MHSKQGCSSRICLPLKQAGDDEGSGFLLHGSERADTNIHVGFITRTDRPTKISVAACERTRMAIDHECLGVAKVEAIVLSLRRSRTAHDDGENRRWCVT